MKKNLLLSLKSRCKWGIITLLLQTFSFCTLHAASNEVQSVFEVSISNNLQKGKLHHFFALIEQESEFRFTYSPLRINTEATISLIQPYKTVGELLTLIASRSDVKFKQINYAIIVSPQAKNTNPDNDKKSNVSGKITDEHGLPLPGAAVMLSDLENVGAVTDSNGEFVILNVPAGEHQVKVSFIGYQNYEQNIVTEAGKTAALNFKMEPGTILGEEVLILGDRLKGQAKALNQQRTNQNITNVVAADQIGRFPDANIGDAVKRIPGITIQNDQGEARDIIIRGMAPELNSVMINGERIPSAEGDNRRVQMDLIPADMIQTIEVNKAVTPDMDADAIGGAVNLITRNAPSGLRVSGTLASGYNFLSEKPIWTGALIIGDRLFNDKLGVIVSGSYNDHDFGSDNVEAAWAEGDNGAYVEELEIREYQVRRVRRSISTALDYTINNNHSIYLKGMYNHRDDWENRFRLSYRDIQEPDENGVSFVESIRRQTKGGIDSDRNDNRRLEDQRVRNITLGGEHLLNNLKLTWSSTYAKASEGRPNERYVQYQAEPEVEIAGEDEPQGMLFIQDLSNPKKPTLTPTSGNGFSIGGNDPSLQNLSLYELDEITEENQATEETDWNTKIDLQIPINNASILKFGGKIRLKEKSRNNDFTEYSFTDDSFETLNSAPTRDVSNSDYLAGEQYQIGNFASEAWLGSFDFTSNRFEGEDKPDEYLPNNFVAEENVFAGYAMIDYQLTPKLSTIAGIRLENTQIQYTGNELVLNEDGDISSIAATSGDDSYTNVLPGLHFKYDLTENSIIRLAWTNTLARPNYFYLVPFREVNFEDNELTVGNPLLKPTTAMNFDIMAEHYFKSVGILSAGVFYKDIDDFIYMSQSQNFNDPQTNQTFETYFQPQNGGKASLYGVELSAQRQLDFLPGIWKGFGVYVNYTYNHSKAEGVANEDGDLRDDLELPGTADHLFNASLSFETSKLVLRVSLNHSSDYIDEVGGDTFTDRYYDKQTFLDVNGSYAFTPQFRFFFEANNLTNQPLRYYQGIPARTMQVEYYNARFNAGVKFDLFKD